MVEKAKKPRALAKKGKVRQDAESSAAPRVKAQKHHSPENIEPDLVELASPDTAVNQIIKPQIAPLKDTRVIEEDYLHVRLSRSLTKKLKEQAVDEGISLEEFVTELLSESVVLRAWEIVERKNAMKGSSQGGNNNSRAGNLNHNNQGNRGHRGNKGQRGMNHMRYQTIMDDKATFLEYVRSQEKNRR